jgi:hypothetical protein
MLRARLARPQDELFRAVPVGVDVDEELQTGLGQPRETEVGDLDGLSLLGREDDAGLGEPVYRVRLSLTELALVDHAPTIGAR